MMYTIRFDTDREFGAWFCFLHLGAHLAANLHKDRSLADVVREAALDRQLADITDVDASQQTPAGTALRQLREGRGQIKVDGDTLAMIDKYVRYGAEKSAPDWAATAVVALEVVARAHDPASR
jgi:hypothetical protein